MQSLVVSHKVLLFVMYMYLFLILKIIYVIFYSISVFILRLEKKLKSIERQQKIQQRWVPESPEYQHVSQLVIESKRETSLAS